ncbi:lipase 3 [Microplitis demolitor]|uniref:lipase 3 n=1 Tax=Microplitis demolitor TaxID=69319 RepID=UPI0004CD682F|nr:lipase 3 [Microplitis demolitor]
MKFYGNYLKNFILLLSISNFASAISIVDVMEFFPKSIADVSVPQTNIFDYNPDVDLPAYDMIKRAGYPSEVHVVTTEDGYLLSLHRIPGKFGSKPIFLQHGLLGSSADWIIPGKDKSLAYLLSDEGYDVWLGNARGNTYSRAHINLSPHDSQFWNFSFHEMGIYDVSAAVSYIVDKTNMSLIYIGHSMGTTMGYVMASERPEISEKIKFMISLAPIGFMSNLKSPVRIVAPFANDIKLVTHFLGVDEFLPQNIFIKYLAKYGCELVTVEKEICTNSIFAITGFDDAQFNQTWLPVILSHTPAGASTKTMVHYAQEILSGKFQQYDYGAKKNIEIYNATYPPEYNLSKIKIPIVFFYADNDWLAAPEDVKKLYSKLPRASGLYRINFSKFNHVDFLWGIDARQLLYNKIIKLININNDL